MRDEEDGLRGVGVAELNHGVLDPAAAVAVVELSLEAVKASCGTFVSESNHAWPSLPSSFTPGMPNFHWLCSLPTVLSTEAGPNSPSVRMSTSMFGAMFAS